MAELLNPVQDILDRMTFKPFWWFQTLPPTSEKFITMKAYHLTVAANKPFDLKFILKLYAYLADHQLAITPTGRGFMFYVDPDQSDKVKNAVAYLLDGKAGFTLLESTLDLPKDFWDEATVCTAVEHLMKESAAHEYAEFTRLDGEPVTDPHPNGSKTVYAPFPLPVKEDVKKHKRFRRKAV